ncbi:MAG: 6-pyruvoyl trahydropterin synthase family protein [Flavobacteriales bacterium]
MIYITRRERFCAAHMLRNEKWDDKKNLEVFGNCSNKNWHGHNFELLVTVKGNINPDTGFLINLKTLSKILKNKVIDKLDHKNINLDVPFMQGVIASTENLTIAIWNEIEYDIEQNGAKIHCVELKETENNFVKYYGENEEL